VLESNLPPVLAAITNRTIAEGSLLTVTNTATDADLPVQQLTFSLGAGAPTGASIHPASGVFTWRPTEFQGGTNYPISVIVTDDGSPSLSATQSFVVTVLDTQADFRLHIGSTAVLSNGVGTVALTLQSGAPLNQVELLLAVSGQRLTDLHLTNLAAQVGSANFVSLGGNRFRMQLERHPAGSLQGSLIVARLGFSVVPDEHSAVAGLAGESLTGVRTDTLTANGEASLGRVFIVGREPILDIARTNNQIALTLYALPGRTCAIEKNSALGTVSGWTFDAAVTPTELRTEMPLRPANGPVEFFRASVPSAPTTLTIRLEGGQVVLEWSLDCVGCVLLQSPSVGLDAVWTQSAGQPQVVNDRYQMVFPPADQPRFLRLIPQP
jgi:hypothetical protein